MPETIRVQRALYRWARILSSRWWIPIAGVGVACATFVTLSNLMPEQYVAESLVAPNRASTQVQFEPSIRSVDANTNAQNPTGSAPERRQALVDLVSSGSVQARVADYLPGTSPDATRVKGELKPKSELIAIKAFAGSPGDAIELAGAWARAYVEVVNTIYSPSRDTSSVVQLRDSASVDLKNAQDALTASLGDGRLEALDWKIADDQQQLALLQAPYAVSAPNSSGTTSFDRDASVSGSTPGSSTLGSSSSAQSGQSLVFAPGPSATPTSANAGSAASNASTQATQRAQLSPASTANDYRLAERRTVDDIANTLRRLDTTRQSLQALMTQSADNSNQAATGTAVALIKAQLVSISNGLPGQLQLNLPEASGGGNQADLESLAASIDEARAQVATEFDRRRQAFEEHRDQQVAAIEGELRTLVAEREAASSERQALLSRRDLAASTHQALARKVEELRVAGGTQAREVELAGVPNAATKLGLPMMVRFALSALVGLGGGCALALAARMLTSQRLVKNEDSISATPQRESATTGQEYGRRAAS